MIVKSFKQKPKTFPNHQSFLGQDRRINQKSLPSFCFLSLFEKKIWIDFEQVDSENYQYNFLYPLLTEIAHQYGILNHEWFFSRLIFQSQK